MGQRVRATVNVRLVVTSDVDEADVDIKWVRDNAAQLDVEVAGDVKSALLDYFATASETVDLFEVDVHHSVVNVNEVPAA